MSVRQPRRKHANGLDKLQLRWVDPPKDKPWARLFIDVIDGAAWRGLSVNARRVLDALICQHFRYCQRDNGNLKISYRGFEKAGVGRRFIAPAIKDLVGASMIKTKQGIPHNGIMRPPTLYHLCMYDEARGVVQTATRRFVWTPVEVMESGACCALSINARRVMDRLLIENKSHKDEANGRLRVSFRQFVGHGIGRRLIGPALTELKAAGLLAITAGKPKGCLAPPHLYRITFLGTTDNPPTWRKLETDIVTLPKPKERKAKTMPSQKLFPTPLSCTGTTPLSCTGRAPRPTPLS